jgi:hypothetical protein
LQPKRFDISDQVLRVLNRTEREQLTKKQQRSGRKRESKEDALDDIRFWLNAKN